MLFLFCFLFLNKASQSAYVDRLHSQPHPIIAVISSNTSHRQIPPWTRMIVSFTCFWPKQRWRYQRNGRRQVSRHHLHVGGIVTIYTATRRNCKLASRRPFAIFGRAACGVEARMYGHDWVTAVVLIRWPLTPAASSA